MQTESLNRQQQGGIVSMCSSAFLLTNTGGKVNHDYEEINTLAQLYRGKLSVKLQ